MAGIVDEGTSIPERTVPLTEHRPPRRWVRTLSIAVLAIALVGVSAALVYSSRSAGAWRDTANRTAAELAAATQQRDAVAAQLKSAQASLASTRNELADTTDKYNAATDRIRSLANEKAQVGDEAALLAEAVALSQRVTTELDTCVTQLQQLQAYLVDYQSYDLESLISYARSVNSGCARARSDNAELAQRLEAL